MLLLKDRILLQNGISVVNPEDLPKFLLKGIMPSQLQVTEITPEISAFNDLSDETILEFTEEVLNLKYDWQIPKEYLQLDLIDFFSKFITVENEQRIITELSIIIDRKLENHIRTIIYLVDYLTENNILWGLGRGSSCACYLLFLIGLHSVDCLKYNISYEEFFK